tara:strand:+ start:4166 stop:4810 length:645 start_codon:yes stop_codon:yes gene_type:complete
MLSALYPSINWSEIDCIGLDLDGTLYDEYEFIKQVYYSILTCHLDNAQSELRDQAYAFMLKRWLEKGSSYNRIFEEAYREFLSVLGIDLDTFVKTSLTLFRQYQPCLTLSPRAKMILQDMKNNHDMFVVSDGCPRLQRNKCRALKLDNVVTGSAIWITGDYGADFYKPSTKINTLIDLDCRPDKVVFVGDRDIDREYAKNSGFQFLQVYNMVAV